MKLVKVLPWFLRNLLSSLLILAVLLLAAYMLFCDQAGKLPSLSEGKKVVLAGIVREVYKEREEEQRVAYQLADPTGQFFVITTLGCPRKGAIVIVWGRKTSTDSGRAVVIERRRLASF